MKILILSDFPNSWPYLPELINHLRRYSVQVDLLDPYHLTFQKDGEDAKDITTQVPFRILLRIPIIRKAARFILLNEALRRFRKCYDVVNIHTVAPFYRYLLTALREAGSHLISTVWGSDFYRIDGPSKSRLELIFRRSDVLTVLNPATARDICTHYGDFSEKCRVIRFGVGSLDVIGRVESQESHENMRSALGVPKDALVICCGYNASPEQAHESIIASISRIAHKLPKNIFLLVPLTYSGTEHYKIRVRQKLIDSGIPHIAFSSRMDVEGVARIRLATDIAVNLQRTDQFSASIQEHLYCGNILIAGAWLPYEVLEQSGIFFEQVRNPLELEERLLRVCSQLSQYREKTVNNRSLVYDLSSWQRNITDWLALYRNLSIGPLQTPGASRSHE